MNCKVPEGEKNAFFSFLKSAKAKLQLVAKMLTHLEEKSAFINFSRWPVTNLVQKKKLKAAPYPIHCCLFKFFTGYCFNSHRQCKGGNGGIPYAGSHGDQLSLVVVTCLIYFCNSLQLYSRKGTDSSFLVIH